MLTEKRKAVLKAIEEYINEHGFAPTVRELCSIMGIHSTSTIHEHLYKLQKEGYIEKNKTQPRTIKIKISVNDI